MRTKGIIRFSPLVSVVLLVAFMIPAELVCKKRKSAFYKGLQEKPVHSSSVITSAVTEYRFQPVLQGDLLEHDFLIKNNRQKPLLIKNIKAG